MNKNLILFSGLIILAGVFVPAVFAQAAFFNTDPSDRTTLRVANATQNPFCTSCWNSTVTANAGDIVDFDIYYHNTSGETAVQTMANSILPSGSSSSFTVTGSVWAQNASVVSGSTFVSITSSQSLSFIPGSVRWYPNQSASFSPLLNGQSGAEIVTASGLNIGDIAAGWSTQGHIVFGVQVSGVPIPPPPPVGNPPVISTGDPGSITDTSAVLKGSVNPNGSNTNAWFEWGRATDGLINVTTQQNMGGGTPYLTYLSGISNLTTGAAYIYRAVAQNAAGTSYGSTLSFTAGGGTTTTTTGGGSGSCLPIVTTNSASFITKDSATLRGLVNPQGRSTSGWFEYGKSYSLTNRTESQTAGSGSVDTDILKYLASLESNTSYYFRAVAQNNCGTANGSILSFTTGLGNGNPPEVATLTATNVTQTSATINGSVNPNNYDTSAWFEWGTNPTLSAYAVTPTANLGLGNLFKAISSMPYGLANNSVYYYRAAAQNAFGIARGTILNFTTGTAAPAPVSGANFSVWKETKNLSFPNGTIYVNSSSIGDTLEFSLNIKNKSSDTLRNIIVKDVLSPYFDFSDSDPETSSDSSGNSLVWNINSIASGETKTISLKVKTKTAEESVVISNSFTAQAEGIKRTSNSTTNILNPSLMALDIGVDKDNVKKNETYDYTIRYRNIGIADIDNALLKIILPQNVTLKDSQPNYATAEKNILFYKIGEINKNGKGTIDISVKVNDSVESGEKLIATAVLDYTDAFGASQPNISASVTSVAESGFFGTAAALGFSLGGSNFGFYLLSALLLAVVGSVVYIRLKVSKMLKV